jgi:TPR repeat protein
MKRILIVMGSLLANNAFAANQGSIPEKIYDQAKSFHLAYMKGSRSHSQKEIAAFFISAAANGSVEARVDCGYCFANGFGVKKNLDIAELLYKSAADQGDIQGQTEYGILMKEIGDLSTAVDYLELAAKQGNQLAKKELQELGVLYSVK